MKWEVKRTVTWQSESHPLLLSLPHTANPLSSSPLSITVHAGHWRVARVVTILLQFCSVVFLSDGQCTYFFYCSNSSPVAAVQRDSSNRNGDTYGSAVAVGGDLIRDRCRFAWGRGRLKDAKGFGQVVGGFLGAFDPCHRNFHLSNEKQSPTSPPNFLRSEGGG